MKLHLLIKLGFPILCGIVLAFMAHHPKPYTILAGGGLIGFLGYFGGWWQGYDRGFEASHQAFIKTCENAIKESQEDPCAKSK